MATAATVPTRTPATEQARKPGGTRSPAPLKASQLPIIRLAAPLGDSLSPDKGSPPPSLAIMSHVTKSASALARAFREILARELEAMVVRLTCSLKVADVHGDRWTVRLDI